MIPTPEYIKMCREAIELQEQWNPAIGDMVVHYNPNEEIQIVETITSMENMNEHFFTKDVVYIPYQEDLQEMLSNHYCKSVTHPMIHLGQIIASFNMFHDDLWKNKEIKYPWNQFNSMNELWLACIMFRLYGKKWDGEEWV